MKTTLELLGEFVDVEAMKSGSYVAFEDPKRNYLRFVVENIDGERISVSHTFIQNGDLMRDPEIVFSIVEGVVVPCEVTMDPLGYYAHCSNMRPSQVRELADLLHLVVKNAVGNYETVVLGGTEALRMDFDKWKIYREKRFYSKNSLVAKR